jgi:hypothetical protein
MMEPRDSEAASEPQADRLVSRRSDKVKEIPSGRRLSRATYTLGPGHSTIPLAGNLQKTRVILLVSGTIVWILGGLAISLLRQQLGISSVVAARIAAVVVAASVAALFLGLYSPLFGIDLGHACPV